MPLVSIVVPVYNVERYLPRCIESILAQSFTDFELLLINDGSTDDSGKICDEYARNDNRIKVFHKENGGVSSARNYGLSFAAGEYISFVDSDDVIHPAFLESLIFFSPESDVVVCDFVNFTNDYPFQSVTSDFSTTDILHLNRENFTQNIKTFSSVWNKLYSAAILKDHSFDCSLKNAEDTLFAYNVLKSCDNICYIKSPLYGYFIRSDGAVGSIDIGGKKDIVKVWTYINNFESGNRKHNNEVRNTWIHSLVSLFYSCTDADKDDYLHCKSTLKVNLLFILSPACSSLNIKEKVFLLLKLLR